jgi:sialidase-1
MPDSSMHSLLMKHTLTNHPRLGSSLSRRVFLRLGGTLLAAIPFRLPSAARAAPVISEIELKSISHKPRAYHGWPTLARRRNGELVLACSGGRQEHVCPFGRVEFMVSHDNGQSWSWPQVVLDSPIDDRDAGVLETAQSTLLVTTFTSLAYEPIFEQARGYSSTDARAWPPEKLRAWLSAHERLSAQQRQSELGQWMIRSTDGGVTWSVRYRSIVNSPHGPIQLSDGRLCYAGKELWTGRGRVGVCQSTDDGQTWQWLTAIPIRPGDEVQHYHELHAVETAPDRIVVHIRNHNPANNSEILQTESADGGRSWSIPHPIGVWGLPSHLLRLRDDRLLMTYGHRRPPLGNQARLSDDDGRTWSAPLLISSDGTSTDLGYPSTVQLDDASIVTVWYEVLHDSPHAVLRQARWSISP